MDGGRGVEGGEPALGEQRSRDIQRTPKRVPPPHRRDGRSRGERVQPLGGRSHPRTHDGDGPSVPVRLVGMDDARIALEVGRDRRSRMPRREQYVAERAAPVELEAAVDGADALDPPLHDGFVPARASTELAHVAEEPVEGREVPVRDGAEERACRAAAHRFPRSEAGKAAREAVAVALGAHRALADRGGAAREWTGGIPFAGEDDHVAHAGMAERQEGGEAGQPAADDRNARLAVGAHSPSFSTTLILPAPRGPLGAVERQQRTAYHE